MTRPATLPDAVVAALRCPLCSAPFGLDGRSLRCPSRHSFDLAKQGYVNLLHAGVAAGTADTAEMVAARVAFLAAGHYAGLRDAIAQVTAHADGLVVDAGAGTGYYLAGVLDRLPGAAGLALDVSALALRRAAKAHPRLGAVVWNLWEHWPVASEAASVVLNVFAPRNGAEFRRVLRPGGTLLVVSPERGHLAELASVAPVLEVDSRKEERLDAALSDHFELVSRNALRERVTLKPDDVRNAVLMGPTGHHPARLAALPEVTEPAEVTFAFSLSEYRRTV
ncbi:23S rRNA (guanine745-N1)-methyltransferase [Amycolatopsis endophytica]|uniref:23S rRNA (Guanine745-N1)-methyltransferase n=1 Tax=Amycolatopsis endophytica TaxID=860233 RepID=A0A853AWB9_9PSEU|nr:rRNA (guanine-N1)-methyltransferase [Amycolatopsis endophytica]NYI86891.1 23S rRNA (guanine745-N1)-methyltransferase [Amycolatopsis endophytica]